ncbi:hypothetical protein B0H19DRAFT_1068108 [Mycena capillaripes]|nr:hypothetical protein B0H19DRAFT_1068108 [Mycena capillaripes]
MYCDSSPFFPPELEREMFEVTAQLYPQAIARLVLVSRRVYEWIERFRYRTIIPDQIPTLRQRMACSFRTLQRVIRSDSKPATFFRDYVRHAFIFNVDEHELAEVLAHCSGIQNLVLSLSLQPSIVIRLTALRPRRLSIYMNEEMDLWKPIFTLVTHLEILDYLPLVPEGKLARCLAMLPLLSHLALFHYCAEVAPDVLAPCRNLEVLVCMHTSYDLERRNLSSVEDIRFVHMAPNQNRAHDWLTGVEGGMDTWARADAFAAKRRRGEIKPSSRCWIEEGDGIGG